MGRTNPKLVPFIKQNLDNVSFINLQYESGNVFYIELPRYDKDKCEDYEAILKGWYDYNGKLHKYISYSNGKSVFQAALKKSVYLMPLPNIGKRLRFRFASSDEIQENKRLLKEKEKERNIHPPSPSNPPSVASSGYISGNDSEAENMLLNDLQGDVWNDILSNPENYIGRDSGILDDFLKDISLDDFKDLPPQNIYPNSEAPQENIQPEDFKSVDNLYQFMKPVTELKTTPVGTFDAVKKYWLCTQKIKVKGTLQLICELQVIEDENSAIKEGLVVIPNDVFEPGVSYSLKKSFVLNDLQYFFFSPNTV